MRSFPPSVTARNAGSPPAFAPPNQISSPVRRPGQAAQRLPPARQSPLPALHVQHGNGIVADVFVLFEERDQIALGRNPQQLRRTPVVFIAHGIRSDIQCDSCRPRCAKPRAWNHPGDQSASFTFSRISRGAPPDSGTRAKVPAVPLVVGPSSIAISPVELMARMRPSGRSSGRYSRLPGRMEKILVGSVAHCALKTTVWPSAKIWPMESRLAGRSDVQR